MLVRVSAVLCLLFSGPVLAKSATYVWSGGGWPPFLMPENNFQSGIAIGLVQATVKLFGYQLDVEHLGVEAGGDAGKKRVIAASSTDKVMCTGPMAKAWIDDKLSSQVLLSDPLIQLTQTIYFKQGASVKALENMVGAKIGACKGYFYSELNPYFEKGSLTRVDYSGAGDKSCERVGLDAMLAGKVDAVFQSDYAVGYFSKQGMVNRKDLQRADYTLSKVDLHLVCAKNEATRAFIREFNASLPKVASGETLARIVKRHTDFDPRSLSH